MHSREVPQPCSNRLSSLPKTVTSLSSLESLVLSGNQFMVFPESISALTKLERLSVGSNPLTALPNHLSRLIFLKHFDAHNCVLSQFAPFLQTATSTQLTTINLSHNKIPSLPTELAGLRTITELYMGQQSTHGSSGLYCTTYKLGSPQVESNQIGRVHPGIGKLVRLKRFIFTWKQIRAAADEISHCTDLKEISVACNQLVTLPEALL